MKYKDIAGKNASDLESQVEKVRKELSQLTLDLRMGKSNKTAKARSMKRDIARLLTAQNQQKKQQESGAAK